MRFGADEEDDAGTVATAPAPARRIARGSEQQEAFWAELRDGTGHVLLEARAGTGKSSSCREGMWRLLESRRGLVIRYCCYNKAIADEFGRDCPPGVDCGTMHRFGGAAVTEAFGSTLDKAKTYALLDQEPGGAALPRYVRRSVATLVSHAKNQALRPGDADLHARLADLADHYDVATWGRGDQVVSRAASLVGRSAECTSVMDFDDMLWLPVVHGLRFPDVDFLFIDECQDLNPTQHELAVRLSGSGRTVVVGDPYQAIYGWRGADVDSIPTLRDKLDAKTLYLTVTWRCPKSHVALARELVPDFEAAAGASEGFVTSAGPDALSRTKPGDLVLCRTNAPLVSACLKEVAARRPAVMRGRGIGEDLLATLRKAERGAECRTVADLSARLARWRAAEVARLSAKEGAEQQVELVQDQCACLDAIAGSCSTPAEIPGVVDELFRDGDTSNRVTFSSVHRAKGSEAKSVSYIQVPYSERRDKVRPPAPWEMQQRRNLRYVALTRSLDSLTLIA